MTEDLNNWIDKEAIDGLANGVMDACTIDGQMTYYPVAVQPQAVIYRMDRFEEAGLKVPATWDEFVDCAKAVSYTHLFAYVTSMSTIVEGYGIATIFGAEIVGGIVAVLVGLSYNKIKSLFPPLIIGIVILCIGLSLYPIAIRYMAGGQGSESYGSWQNWLVAALTLTVVIVCNNYGRGIIKLASVPVSYTHLDVYKRQGTVC